MRVKTIQSVDNLHKNRAEFAGCLHEEDLKLLKVSCCFPCFMFTLRIKQGFHAINHIKLSIKENQNKSSQSFLCNPSTLKSPSAHVCQLASLNCPKKPGLFAIFK